MREVEKNFEHTLWMFEFNKVYKIMLLLDWKWHTGNNLVVPDVNRTMEMCRELFVDCLEVWDNPTLKHRRYICAESGGFRVSIFKGKRVGIEFILESGESETIE